jgi:hypothetical protein
MFIKINFEAFLSVEVITTLIIAVVFSLLFIWLDYREKKDEAKSDQERAEGKLFYRLRLFFTFLLGLLAIYEAYSHKQDEITSNLQQKKQDSTIIAKQDSIRTITNKLDSTSNKLNEKNDVLIASQKDINEAQGHTIRSQDELFNQITGGNSVAFLQLQIKGIESDVANEFQLLQLQLFNLGKYPIENVSVSYFQEEDRKPKTFPPRSKNYVNQKPVVRILFGDVYLYAMEKKSIKNIELDYDTTNLIDVRWTVNVFWKSIKYSVNFKIFPPLQNLEDWKIEDISISIDGKNLTEEELISYIQKKLKVH